VARFVSRTWWIASGLAMAACGNGRTVPVCADGSGLYATIAEAIAGEPSGTTIDLCPGTYAETLSISGKSFTLRGESADTTILDAGGAGSAITVIDGGVTIEGLTIRNAASPQRAWCSALRCWSRSGRSRSSASAPSTAPPSRRRSI
jgi:nitrous oxidase accessory protein NosD